MATHKKTILFIGYGNLAKSILNKDLKKNFQIYFVNSNKKISSINFKKTNNVKFDIVFLLVKPNIFYNNGKEFSSFLNKNTLIISFMAGVKVQTISKKLNHSKVVRVMPSVLAKFKSSFTCVYSKESNLSRWTVNKITNLFGNSFIVDQESDIHKATVLFGSGPAFIAHIIDSYLKATKKFNFKYIKNSLPILDMFLFVITNAHHFGGFENFIKSISSKKGITQEGINYLSKSDLKKTMYTSLIRSYKRSKELSFEK